MKKHRTLARTIRKALKTFPAIVLTGPRQAGKTTLFKMLFSKTHKFVSLEDPDTRMRAKEDPRGFLARFDPPLLIDEIQYVPELLSYIKTKIDENRSPGRWLFTGSQNYVLMEGVSQSLAGRAAVLSLLPFSFSERINTGDKTKDVAAWLKAPKTENAAPKFSLAEVLLRGNYPEIASNKKVDRQLWCGSYISTYIERDIRNLSQIGDISQFEKFLRLAAVRTGQILNLSELAAEMGISVPTAKRWLSLLEAGYQIYLLYPYYKNIGKRMRKSPKLYFNDTALAAYLLGIHDQETLVKSPHFASLFETMIVNDFLKRFLHFGQRPSMYYLRTRDKLEVNLAIEDGGKLHLFEIKSAMTIFPKHADSIRRASQSIKEQLGVRAVISRAPGEFIIADDIYNYNWADVLAM